MKRARSGLMMATLLALSACTVAERPQVAAPAPVITQPTKADRWRAVATSEDVERLRRLPMAWSEGLAEVRAARSTTALREEGSLLEANAGLARPAPTPGSYNCRLVRLGKTDRRAPALVKFKPFFCYVEVENDLLTIVKQTGTERPAGRLWEDDVANRLIFLGSIALGEKERNKPYGEDASRDMAGVVERVGPMRWRLALPFPRSGARLEVYELTPVAVQPEA
jgi:hypothetical protein